MQRKNPPHPPRSTDTHGFTLFEILIAMFIFGVVLSTIFTSYTGTFRIIEETEAQADIYAMARVAMARMQEDLESIHFEALKSSERDERSTHPMVFVGENKYIEGRDADSLRFLSRAHLGLDQRGEGLGVAEISYYVSEKETEEALVLYRSETPRLNEPPQEGTGGMVLCDGLFAVEFIFYDKDGQTHENWDASAEEFERSLPKRISIMLEFVNERNPDAPHKFISGFAIPMAKETYDVAGR
jgi:general secretion pathway protein J